MYFTYRDENRSFEDIGIYAGDSVISNNNTFVKHFLAQFSPVCTGCEYTLRPLKTANNLPYDSKARRLIFSGGAQSDPTISPVKHRP